MQETNSENERHRRSPEADQARSRRQRLLENYLEAAGEETHAEEREGFISDEAEHVHQYEVHPWASIPQSSPYEDSIDKADIYSRHRRGS